MTPEIRRSSRIAQKFLFCGDVGKYMVRSKSSRNILIWIITSCLDPILHHDLQSSPLEKPRFDRNYSATLEMHSGSGLFRVLAPSAFPLDFSQIYQIFATSTTFSSWRKERIRLEPVTNSERNVGSSWSGCWISLQTPKRCCFYSYCTTRGTNFVAISLCSVPPSKLVDMYQNLVPRCYRVLRWSVYDPTESDP
jgi:hypothetical protein